jgi:AcrR family transcriptional regulator
MVSALANRKLPRKNAPRRGATVIRRTLDATVAELGRAGYAALRVDDVARRARVNKTTVYRRWPTKDVLVRAALGSLVERASAITVPNTGSLHGDLVELAQQKLRFARSSEGCALIRAVEAADPELMTIVGPLRALRDVIFRTVLERARARGVIRADVDISLFIDIVQLACDHARSRPGGRVDAQFVNGLVDLLLRGAGKPAARNSKLRSRRP